MNMKEAKTVLQAADYADDAVLFESVHGIGKSEMISQFAKENNYYCQELFLSMFDVGDLTGIPRVIVIGGIPVTTWAAPDWYQKILDSAFPPEIALCDILYTDPEFQTFVEDNTTTTTINRDVLNNLYIKFYSLPDLGDLVIIDKTSRVGYCNAKRSVLLLDEINRSNLDVRQAALQLVLNKRLHCHKLPYINGKPTIIVAAANPADVYQVEELDPALVDRFLFGAIEVDAPVWLDWARENNVNHIVTAYIAEHPDHLHFTPKDQSIGATPRSWTKLGLYIDNATNIPVGTLFQVVKGKIGTALAAQFITFYNNYASTITAETIEKAITKINKSKPTIEEAAAELAELLSKQQPIQLTQLGSLMWDKYLVEGTTAKKALPLLIFLYSLNTEVRAGFLTDKRSAYPAQFKQLAAIDGELNDKKLFFDLIAKVTK